MGILTFQQLIGLSQVFFQEWANLTVKDEILRPAIAPGATSADGTRFMSYWDNWLIPGSNQGATSEQGTTPVGAIIPLIVINGVIQDPGSYTITGGDSVRGLVVFNKAQPTNPFPLVFATYRRSLFTLAFWANALQQAAREIGTRLLTTLDYQNLDDATSPWELVVKQTGLHVMINLQVMLAGMGKTAIGREATIDLSQAAKSIDLGIQTLNEDIDHMIVTQRWISSPLPIKAYTVPLPGPFGGLY